MNIDKHDLLEKLKNELKPELTKISYDTWIKTLEIQSIDGNHIIFIATSEFHKDFIENKYKDWQIRSFSENKIELYKTEDKICDKHYIIKEKDGCIAIYTLDSAGNQNLKEVTDIQVQYLPEEDINLLKKGIGVIGDVELAKRIEDYE